MRTSVVIRSRNEAPRLRLTLASLEAQQDLAEVVVVDDGSQDETSRVCEEAARRLPLRSLHNLEARGRSAAANRGAIAATGELLIFLDGDTLAAPGMVAAHRAVHAAVPRSIGRGETWHLRCTRFLLDPETGAFQHRHAARRETMTEREWSAMRVTASQVRGDFEAIERRGAPGVYPGVAPARLHQDELRALRCRPDSALLWAAASGSNLSVPRADFAAVGGFDEALDINEHRELAYRLCRAGSRMRPALDARTYHLTHRSGWRDPLQEPAWEQQFRRTHPAAPLDRLTAYWRAISADGPVPDLFG